MKWQLQEAKNKFSEVMKRALSEGPQVITMRGKKAAMLLSIEDYEKLIKPKQNLVDFFQQSPLKGIELDLERRKDVHREVIL
jgi:prevent-host-death family protein